MDVTARELKLRLGKCLAAVRAGQTLRVTLRGRPVAEIRPISAEPQTEEEFLDQLAAQGLLRRGNGKKLEPFEPISAPLSATDIILSDREDERP